MNKLDLVIAMPVFNESDGILEFIADLEKSFSSLNYLICLVDDASTDGTTELLSNLAAKNLRIIHIRNMLNLGHGPSTLKALTEAVSKGTKFVLAVDGDGQFATEELKKFFDFSKSGNFEYAEGIRVFRSDPWFRKLISLATRVLVAIKSGETTRDANTPCRIYASNKLNVILNEIPQNSIVPNLHISIYARKNYEQIQVMDLNSLDRRGHEKQGSSWGKKMRLIPNRTLIKFCLKAVRDIYYI